MDAVNRIYNYTLETIMEDRFTRYSRTIIQDRALPDVRDGLKPVQRRILYAMYRDHNTFDKAYKKSAKAVGNIMGKYHPHGDSSIYDAMVRMSQWWKQNTPYIDMHGNNGSIDGDSAAAMRYTEARLSKISNELLKDIDKNTVEMVWNFDDTEKEPVVLPAKFPNLLVNGSNGISAGYATNIPPHNLGEIIDATIKRIDSPNCRLETILDIIKGPDFPTGAIVEGKKGIIDAFTTGRGKVIVKSKIECVKEKGKIKMVVSELPFEVNKANLVRKIDEIRIDKKIDGIIEVLDESNFEDPTKIGIFLKKDADQELILNYLLKNTDLQISYNYNMVAIVSGRPMTIGILKILDEYIHHQKDIITRRTKFDLKTAQARMHIIEGLIKALSILDEIIKTIRASKNKSDAKINLMNEFGFTEMQAEAIVVLQLYKLTNTDVIELSEEMEKLKKEIFLYEQILNNDEALKHVMKNELKAVKMEYALPRKTEIKDEVTEIKIDTKKMLPKEECMVVVTKEGYVKRVSLRSYDEQVETTLKEGDYILGKYKMNTMDTILMFTNLGNYLYVPVHELPDLKWKELGKHISNIINISSDESILYSMPVYDFNVDQYITIFTKNGMVKRTSLKDFKVQRYSKTIMAIKLKDQDEVVSVTDSKSSQVFVVTYNGYGLCYKAEEIPITGPKGSGVKSIQLKNDFVVAGMLYNSDMEYLTLITSKNTAKRVKLTEFECTSRARRGVQVVREVKTNPYYILKAFIVYYKESIGLKTKEDITSIKLTDIPICDRYATGSNISKLDIIEAFEIVKVKTKEEKEEPKEKENISLESIDHKILTIDDFLDDIEDFK